MAWQLEQPECSTTITTPASIYKFTCILLWYQDFKLGNIQVAQAQFGPLLHVLPPVLQALQRLEHPAHGPHTQPAPPQLFPSQLQ